MSEAFITLKKAVNDAIRDQGLSGNPANFLGWAADCVAEMQMDALKNLKRVVLPVDQATKTVAIPSDAAQYTRVGFQNTAGEIVDLTYNPLLKTGVEITKVCDCPCGCTDECCVAETTTTIETVVLPTPQRLHAWRVLPWFTYEFCDYEINVDLNASTCSYRYLLAPFGTSDFPMTVNYYMLNGIQTDVDTTCADGAALDTLMTGFGFTVNTSGTTYTSPLSEDIYGIFNVTLATTGEDNILPTPSCFAPVHIGNGGFPSTIDSYTKNGELVLVGTTVYTVGQLTDFFTSIGFSNVTDTTYSISASYDIWGEMTITNAGGTFTVPFEESGCSTLDNSIIYPFKVVQYVKNNTIYNVDVTITESEDDGNIPWFNSIGLYYDATYFVSLATTDSWQSMTFEDVHGIQTVQYFTPEAGEVVTSDVSYQKVTTIKTDDCSITREVCAPGYTQTPTQYDFKLVLTGTTEGDFPTEVVIVKNGQQLQFTCQTLYGDTDSLESALLSLGFYVGADYGDATFYIIDTTDIYSFCTISSTATQYTFEQTFTSQEQWVVEQCRTDRLCEITTRECGCIELTDTVIDVLNAYSIWNNPSYQRALVGADVGQRMAIPNALFGYYNVDLNNRVIYLDQWFPWDAVLLEYYSVGIDGDDFLIPVQMKFAISQYIMWKSILNKRSASISEKQYAFQQWIREKNTFKQRWSPLRLPEWLDLLRSKIAP